MTAPRELDGVAFAEMINGGAAILSSEADAINDLNVFPIPDGDTGDNMLMTVKGGAGAVKGEEIPSLSDAAKRVADGMLLGARGNSGVILSQFFDGIAEGFEGLDEADTEAMGKAFACGVEHAYASVLTPTEGTLLTVAKDAAAAASAKNTETPSEFMEAFIDAAEESLAHTPDLLPVLKEAGVVDAGGAGLIAVAKGMKLALDGEQFEEIKKADTPAEEIDYDLFDADSELTFGYCTEVLLRLQNAKTDPATFDTDALVAYLSSIGDSVVAVKKGTAVKIHVHTKTPEVVFSYLHQDGEFLKLKVENMSLQHSNAEAQKAEEEAVEIFAERRPYAAIAVAAGEGIKETFLGMGADAIVDGGQSMNPSTEDFIKAFDRVNADVVVVFPNNGNVILTAKQAAAMYDKSDIRVIESRTLGDGYAALSMLDFSLSDTDAVVEQVSEALEGVTTAEISRCVREVTLGGVHVNVGDYIGFVGKNILAADSECLGAACKTADALSVATHDICIVICGAEATREESDALYAYIHEKAPMAEVFMIDGGQDIYSYIIVVE